MATTEYSSVREWPTVKTTLQAGQTLGRMKLLKVGDATSLTIENRGMKIRAKSPRVYYTGPSWYNVDFSAEVKLVNNMEQSYLVVRSDHETRPCGFGGYDLYVDLKDEKIFWKKEIHHDFCPTDGFKGYSSRLKSVSVDVEEGTWFKQRAVITNTPDGKVKLEAYFNGVKKNELIDSGQIECKDKNDNKVKTPAYTGTGKWCYTRANAEKGEVGEIRYKNLLVKPI